MCIVELYLQGKSIPLISAETKIPRSTVRFRLKKAGVLRSRDAAIRLAAEQGRLSNNKGIKRAFTTKWKENLSKSLIAKKSRTARGISVKPSGYVEFTRGEHKGRGVHVVVMEQQIGRRLFANEVVHHKDGNRANNEIENLQLMTRAEHASHHAHENCLKRKRKQNGRFE